MTSFSPHSRFSVNREKMPFHHVTAGLLYKGNYLNRSLSAGSDSEQLANISVEELDGKEPALCGRSATHGRHLRRLCVYGESARLRPPVVAKANGGADGNGLREKFCINDFFVRDRPRYLVSLYTDWGDSLQLPKYIFQFTESLSPVALSCFHIVIYAGPSCRGGFKPC